MTPEKYKDFIREAFISPLRSVLVVDDDYPTIEELLGADIPDAAAAPKAWRANPAPILEVIKSFRTSTPPLMVDVHDGSNVEFEPDAEAIKHLHQTDLLVLDYQLDRGLQGDGTKAIAVARAIVKNHNFNLVVVHTGENLDLVFQSFLVGLLSPITQLISEEETLAATVLLEEAEDDSPGISQSLVDSISQQHYLYVRQTSTAYPIKLNAQAPSFAAFEAIGDSRKWSVENRRIAFVWALNERQNTMSPRMFNIPGKTLSWSDTDPRWIRTDTAFFAFSAKGQADDLIAQLLNALSAWGPRPSRLFLAKMRAVIDRHGVGAESTALGSDHVLAHWYKGLLEVAPEARDSRIAESVGRNTEQLLDNILPGVNDFAQRLVISELDDAQVDVDKICQTYFKVDLKKAADRKLAVLEHNVIVSSKPSTGYHLATGHVFQIAEDYWVCLSPLCDLVPGQGPARYEMLGDLQPFIAVKLQSLPSDAPELKRIQSNRFIFLRINGTIKTFTFNNRSAVDSAPHWFTLYAKQNGKLSTTKAFEVLRMERAKNHRLVARTHSAQIVGQLRYEYALNLLQKLGGLMMRVGLDFADQ
ncbi:response regulator receiver domain [Mesorhizobium huakuii]|uniref:Response regulator receiver domain n=1 Tax=Mesorhizobium huakuii TaxID=28104 RepID=A0ABZ0VQY6_9HYPH|nr:response regulator receiver domain [Mesorhizobium huakuii]WQB98669.1 response regulator receiver domain [Mesorhizobium huakuii]